MTDTLTKIREAVAPFDCEGDDDMPISFVGTLGNLKKLIAVADAAIALRETEMSMDPENIEETFHSDDCFKDLENAENKLDTALAALNAKQAEAGG